VRPHPGSQRPEVARLGHAARVAAIVAGLIAILYVAVTVPLDFAEGRHLVAEVDAKLSDRLADFARGGYVRFGPLRVPAEDDVSQAPVVVWEVGPSGKAVALSAGAPPLAGGAWPRPGRSVTERVGGDVFRLRSESAAGRLLVVGQSLAEANRVESALQLAEVVGGPVFVLVVFLAAFGIGAVASKPVEEARRRQVEFTADASHELRTPITVIEAEVGLALGSPRENDAYREALERVGRESKRLRRIVEDMLFLARFGTTPPPPGEEPVDVVTVAEACVNRFAAVARARGAELSLGNRPAEGALITAPPEWVDRLCGTLVDNACKHAGPGGRARVAVEVRGQTVTLLVEDSGPGIPPEERPYLFDRFHKGNGNAEGAGLGLAIADAVVGATGGRWRVGTSDLGGAYMAVSWRRRWPREISASRRRGWLPTARQLPVRGDGDP
jgi:signal transduction histidine kinase